MDVALNNDQRGWVEALISLLATRDRTIAGQARDSLLLFLQAVASQRSAGTMPFPLLARLHG